MPYVLYENGEPIGLFADPVGCAVWEPEAPPTPLAMVAEQAVRAVDHGAEAARAMHLTPGAGQAMAYQSKAAEAAALLVLLADGGEIVAADYPHIAAEVGITADTLVGVAEVVAAMATAWATASAAIEATRLSAKAAVKAAATPAEISAILDGLTWPSPSQE
jgi:hypothetical protein